MEETKRTESARLTPNTQPSSPESVPPFATILRPEEYAQHRNMSTVAAGKSRASVTNAAGLVSESPGRDH
ncbi:unnamed protein product [Zymoseptoria tritici ST99CH_3D7]|uniref:Uncharacterized protein n=1 Tax=Zymoseptoria tritici (strain ST99CH_3D7) TaxID=1276538 RepID=A0A1X7S9Q5_ZYMT9|nr:unnamed protein product [Zymoseptoria tritici ST99CH_3D7]